MVRVNSPLKRRIVVALITAGVVAVTFGSCAYVALTPLRSMEEVGKILANNMDRFRPAADKILAERREQSESYLSFEGEALPSPFDELSFICDVSVSSKLPAAVNINVVCADGIRLGYFLVPHPTTTTLHELKKELYGQRQVRQIAPNLYRYGGEPAPIFRTLFL